MSQKSKPAIEELFGKVMCGDCLKAMPMLPDHSVDLILADLPYEVTHCSWDSIIPLDKLWKEYKRLLAPQGNIVLTATQPFASKLIISNEEWFKYDIIWVKNRKTNIPNARRQVMRNHESVLVFNEGSAKYNPQMIKGEAYTRTSSPNTGAHFRKMKQERYRTNSSGERFPESVIYIPIPNDERSLHRTQKPVALFRYLIETFTNPLDVVLDNTAGSGTTGVACIESNRLFILMEKDREYCGISYNRIKKASRIKTAQEKRKLW